jgi:hypothetical protein
VEYYCNVGQFFSLSFFFFVANRKKERKNRQVVSWGLDIWTLELTWLDLSSKIIEVVSWPLTWVKVEKEFKELGQRTYCFASFAVLSCYPPVLWKLGKKRTRGTALLVFVLVLKNEKWNQNQIGRLFCFFRKSEPADIYGQLDFWFI